MNRVWSWLLPRDTHQPAPTGALTGDALMEALVPLAADLVTAVHATNRAVIADILEHARVLAGDPLTAAQHLAVLAAGMASEDHAPAAALGWNRNRALYRQLRATTDALTASLRAGSTAQPGGPA